MKRFMTFLVMLCGLSLSVFAQALDNLALHTPYTLQPAPNYGYCTDAGDATQLTDGVYTQGHFWTQASTVGWQSAKPVVVTVDLGADKPVRGVSFHTAAGVAGVAWPLTIYVFVAGEDKQYYPVGNLVTMSLKHGTPPATGYADHRYWTDELRTHARYVAFAFEAQPYAFVDEVEVYAGDPAWLAAPRAGQPVPDVKDFLTAQRVNECILRRLTQDLQGLRDKVKTLEFAEGGRQSVLQELDAIEQALAAPLPEAGPDFKAVLPLNPLHARLFRAQAALWRAQQHPPLTLWASGLWEPLSVLADPPREAGVALSVAMMSNEYRAAAFNVSNATDQPMPVKLRITGLPGGVNPRYLRVSEVPWTDTKEGVPVAAALPDAARDGEDYAITVPSGMTRQVWLTFHPVDVPAGDYHGTIEVRAASLAAEGTVNLRIYPLQFPDQPALHLGGWDYTNVDRSRGVTGQTLEPLIAELRAHFVDSPWGTSEALPLGTFDAQGAMTQPPDTANFDAWLQRWPGARNYYVFAAVGDHIDPGLKMGTPEFENAVKAWASFWATHAKAKGLQPQQIGVLLVDEPYEPAQDAVILAWAKPLRAANTGIRVWEDPTYHDMSKANPDMAPACDVLCPNRQIFLGADSAYRAYYTALQEKGATLEFYSCSGPTRLLDPYAYYRLQAWSCWQYNATAGHFWAFGDNGGVSCWNEYLLQGADYCPVFLDDRSVTPAKQLEACREGIEDYEYLRMLKDAIVTAKGASPETLERARKLLAEAPERVCKEGTTATYRWLDPMDRSVADQARVEILEMLKALRAGK